MIKNIVVEFSDWSISIFKADYLNAESFALLSSQRKLRDLIAIIIVNKEEVEESNGVKSDWYNLTTKDKINTVLSNELAWSSIKDINLFVTSILIQD